ncbi:SRPBCC family protein [Pelomonas sp. KK5]|uniref:SRPBCC family protein n=1 Tax=Pelomonas sp. KK5 TaxID=1855730 RepID=UPI00097C990B|nr:SRPBCC family protein [Pelomonas sp. KK5]
MPSTIRLHRVIKAPPERIYRAFTNPDAWSKWLPPHGFIGKVHEMEPRVGGRYRMSFINMSNDAGHSFGGEYLELVPNEKLRYTAAFDDANLPGQMQTTITLREVFCGTEFTAVQEGIPDMIPPEMCYLGWQESLQLLAQLVEANVPG